MFVYFIKFSASDSFYAWIQHLGFLSQEMIFLTKLHTDVLAEDSGQDIQEWTK